MFQKAQRKSVKIKLAITGPSGSGKTYSALKIATGLGAKIAVIDTENGSASLYSEYFDFDVMEMQPPFTPEKYIEAINAAEKAKYDVLIIDSLSHEWEGEGGLLQMKEQLDQRGGNSFTNWGKMTKPHNAFNSAYLHSPLHIIATMRSKQDYIIEANEKGKQTPRKVGLKPIQRDGTEYEFTMVFDIAMNHEASMSKDRTNLFTDKVFKITEQTGIEIKNWLNSSKAVVGNNTTSQNSQQNEHSQSHFFNDTNSKSLISIINDLTKNIKMEDENLKKFKNELYKNAKDKFLEAKMTSIIELDIKEIFNDLYNKYLDGM